MAHSKHRKKTLRQATAQRLVNRAERSTMRGAIKNARTAAESDPENADPSICRATQLIDKAGKRRVIHPNKASRIKSRLAKAKNRALAEKQS